MAVRIGFWAGKQYNLSRMSMRELVAAYFTHYAVAAYFALAALAVGVMVATQPVWDAAGVGRLAAAALAAVVVYPLVWYGLHRWVLHGRLLYRFKATAPLWKRIHFDHHQDPHDLGVLFGALYTTLPTILIVTGPIGWLIGGLPAAAACISSALLTTCFYEFCHSAQHLNVRPPWNWLQRTKELHLSHHFRDENGNFGITNYVADRALGSFYSQPKDRPKSATVFNLGYDEAVAERFPWVAALSGEQGFRTGAEGKRWKPMTPHAGAEAVGVTSFESATPRNKAA